MVGAMRKASACLLFISSLVHSCTCFIGVETKPLLERKVSSRLLHDRRGMSSQKQPLTLCRKSIKELLEENDDALPNQPLKPKNCSPEHEFELNRGLAVDTLLSDYPYLLERAPDFSIFRKDIILTDAQGFSISGLQAYQLFFGILRRLAFVLHSQAVVYVMLMDKYATDKSKIRLRWKIELNGRSHATTSRDREAMLRNLGFEQELGCRFASSEDSAFVLEGISVYKLDTKGMINSHTIEITEPTVMAPLAALQRLIPSSLPASFVPDIIPS
mmetsp:Transcript_27191/g.88859  ORF Transcript_27191/g.88859 Transcript_27191/m.88859 type:complete len:273 (+) Transcript_27191:198-1016(+)